MQISIKWKDVAFVHMPDIKQMFVFDIFKLCTWKINWTHNIQGKQENSKKCKTKIKIKHFLFLNTGLK